MEWATRTPQQPKAAKPSPHCLLIGQGSLLILLLVIAIGLAVLPQISCTAGILVDSELSKTLLEVDYFNGSPGSNQNVGRVTGTLLTTTVNSLGWNGAPFTWVDTEERDFACAGPLVTSDACAMLNAKIQAADELRSTTVSLPANPITTALTSLFDISLAAALLFTVAQLVTFSKGFHLAGITRDPSVTGIPLVLTAFSFFFMLVSFIPPPPSEDSISATLNPALVNLFVNRSIGLGGLWWGGAQTIFGVNAVIAPLAPLNLSPLAGSCVLPTASTALRAASLGMVCASTIMAMLVRSTLLKEAEALTAPAPSAAAAQQAAPPSAINPVYGAA
jgi:hypothetical protein